jgi:hypothetical protein
MEEHRSPITDEKVDEATFGTENFLFLDCAKLKENSRKLRTSDEADKYIERK